MRHDEKIPVNKDRLHKKLQENKETHKVEYREAMVGYKEAVLEDLDKQIKKLQEWRAKVEASQPTEIDKQVPCHLNRPQDHTEDYQQAIAVMDWHQDSEIKISLEDFDAYVRDKWPWQQMFKATHLAYNSPR